MRAWCGLRREFVKIIRWDECTCLLPKLPLLLCHPGSVLNKINRLFIPTSCNFFFRSQSPKNSKVKRAWFEIFFEMGDRPESSSRVRTSEGSLCPKKLPVPDVSGSGFGEAGRYSNLISTKLMKVNQISIYVHIQRYIKLMLLKRK